jgi:hypothetical protein
LRFEREYGAARPDAAAHPIAISAFVAADIGRDLAGLQALANESHLGRIDAPTVAKGTVEIAECD